MFDTQKIDSKEKMHNENRRDGKREKEERMREGNKEGRVCMQSKRLYKFHILSTIC